MARPWPVPCGLWAEQLLRDRIRLPCRSVLISALLGWNYFALCAPFYVLQGTPGSTPDTAVPALSFKSPGSILFRGLEENGRGFGLGRVGRWAQHMKNPGSCCLVEKDQNTAVLPIHDGMQKTERSLAVFFASSETLLGRAGHERTRCAWLGGGGYRRKSSAAFPRAL